MNDNSPEPRGISNLREPSFTLSTRMIEAMLGDAEPAPRLIALTNTRLQNSRLVSESALAAVAESVVNSAAVMSIYAACEWDCLDSDGKDWIMAIIRETLRRAETIGRLPCPRPFEAVGLPHADHSEERCGCTQVSRASDFAADSQAGLGRSDRAGGTLCAVSGSHGCDGQNGTARTIALAEPESLNSASSPAKRESEHG